MEDLTKEITASYLLLKYTPFCVESSIFGPTPMHEYAGQRHKLAGKAGIKTITIQVLS